MSTRANNKNVPTHQFMGGAILPLAREVALIVACVRLRGTIEEAVLSTNHGLKMK
jgi:hypothetical protein